MAIRYLSFDFDGCLFNSAYIKLPHNQFSKHLGNDVIDMNRAFLDEIKKDNAEYKEIFAFIGSNRQSQEIDALNIGGPSTFKGSCCTAIKTICNYLEIMFDPFLLADIYGELESGTSYSRIMDEIIARNHIEGNDLIHQHATCTSDQYKRTLVFAQMQKAAADHPGEEIVFDFFDDREDILGILQQFFTEHNQLIPKGITLRLNHYAGEEVTLKTAITGTGINSKDYRKDFLKLDDPFVNIIDVAKEMNFVASEIGSNNDSSEKETIEKEQTATALEGKTTSIAESYYKEIRGSSLFFNTPKEAEEYLKRNPMISFVIRESSISLDDMYTFTLVTNTLKGMINIRCGINPEGDLFVVDNSESKLIGKISGDVIEALSELAATGIKMANEHKDINQILFFQTSNTSSTERDNAKEKTDSLEKQGFFGNSKGTELSANKGSSSFGLKP